MSSVVAVDLSLKGSGVSLPIKLNTSLYVNWDAVVGLENLFQTNQFGFNFIIFQGIGQNITQESEIWAEGPVFQEFHQESEAWTHSP